MKQFVTVEVVCNDVHCLPEARSPAASGSDLSSAESVKISPKEIKLVSTGIRITPCKPGIFAMVVARSSLHKKGLKLANSIGIIDPDYTGGILLALENFTDEEVTIDKHQRLAQLLFIESHTPLWKTVDELTPTVRASGGFGSTGDL